MKMDCHTSDIGHSKTRIVTRFPRVTSSVTMLAMTGIGGGSALDLRMRIEGAKENGLPQPVCELASQ